MKKFLSILVLVVLVTPQVAMAAWWNPFSWSVFQKKETNVQQLESRIKDLEKKLEETSGKKSATTTSEVSSMKVDKPVVKKAEKAVPVPVSVEKEAAPAAPKTFVLPNGAVVDGAGNVVGAAPEQPTQSSVKDDKFTGENYFRENKTCAGLKDVNVNQHSFCVSYALNGASSMEDKPSRLNAVNLKIANLNAKYAKEAASLTQANNPYVDSFSLQERKHVLYKKYSDDYNILMAEYQQIQYAN